jgi:hypothetical protein
VVLCQPIWKWRPVEIIQYQESIQDVEIEQCWICAVLWWPFWKWRPVEIFRCQESIRDIIICPYMKWRWNRTMLNLCGNVVAILKMVTGRNFSISGINSGHHYLPTYQNFDDIGQCWIFTAHFLCHVLAAILKMADISKILKTQNCSSNGDLSLCQILCLYHYPFISYQH